jgi:drug/metabolite transporter (DMT)-like permease
VSLLLALLSSLVLGAADFAGGLAAKRMRTIAVVIWSNAAGLLVALAAVAVVVPGTPRAADLGWGVLAGLCGSVGAGLLYRALASGAMLLAAPVAAVAAALLPVIAGVTMGERLGPLTAAGVGIAVISVALVSRRPADRIRRPASPGVTVLLGTGAGLGFGAFMVALSQTPSTSGLWPLVFARCASLTVLLAVAAAHRVPIRPVGAAHRLAWFAGVLDIGSSVFYLLAVREGSLALVGLLASLSPVSTVLLARLLLRERTYLWQRIGAGLAMSSVLLLALG